MTNPQVILIFFFPLQSQRAMKKIISLFETFPTAQHFKYPPLPLFPRFPRLFLLTYFLPPPLESTPSSHTSLILFFFFFSTFLLSRFHSNQRHPCNYQDKSLSLLKRITAINPLNHTHPYSRVTFISQKLFIFITL